MRQPGTVERSGQCEGLDMSMPSGADPMNERNRKVESGSDPAVLTVAGDISDPATSDRIIGGALEGFGRVDSLINNAGVFVSKPFVEFTQADYDHNLEVNVAGFFHITQRAAAEMLKQGSGHIVSITAALVDQPIAGVPAALAALTKGALNAVTRSLAIEFASRGVRVNAVAPGIMKTPMNPEATHEALAKLHPVGRMGEARDIAEAVLYLEHAPFVTGEILRVDGGQHAGRW
jgi:NAD(P)-dependent dehydrogenase (short-subunit alcohol dehydrogenase family)